MQHQNWEPVVFTKLKKNTEEIAAAAAAGTVDNYQRRKAHKLDAHTGGEDDVDTNHKKQQQQHKAKLFRTNLTSYRTQHQLTQKELAAKLNIKLDIITSIENGKMIPDPSLVQRIRNRLQTLIT
jgi:ribosome-binding protein aMBF1 (putative translation factor)